MCFYYTTMMFQDVCEVVYGAHCPVQARLLACPTLKQMRVLHATSAWVQCLAVKSARIDITDCVYLMLSCV